MNRHHSIGVTMSDLGEMIRCSGEDPCRRPVRARQGETGDQAGVLDHQATKRQDRLDAVDAVEADVVKARWAFSKSVPSLDLNRLSPVHCCRATGPAHRWSPRPL